MAMVCPRCSKSFEDRMLCPTCNVRLVSSGSALHNLDTLSQQVPTEKWQQTFIGRGIAGLMLAQGLYYGLWQLATAVVMGTSSASNRVDWYLSSTGWIMLQVFQAFSLLIGGGLAGAGQRYGVLVGMGVGFVNGILWLLVQSNLGHALTANEVYAQPLFQLACAAVGGFLGTVIWKPIVPIGEPATSPSSSTLRRVVAPRATQLVNSFRGPVAWFKVGVGTLIGVGGSMWANLILTYIVNNSVNQGVRMSFESQRHAQFVTWEVSVLLMLLAGAVAGANCRNGLKQGFVVGLAVSIILVTMYIQDSLSEIPQTLLITSPGLLNWRLHLAGSAPIMVYTLCSVFPLGLIGGWFGSQLLPPLLPRRPGPKRPYPVSA